ncbi:MAG TPA: inositol monophosphatase family protein [Patescibacteria group bacterium]|nr:inositol monophosphatase family protein [Patescibacteria group bacterium]
MTSEQEEKNISDGKDAKINNSELDAVKKDTYVKIKSEFPGISQELTDTFLKYFYQDNSIKYKTSNRDIVTKADLEIEKIFTSFIHKRFPKHRVVGEETYDPHEKERSDWVWYIDPIDGTTNFAHHNEECAIMVGLLHKHRPFYSWINFPVKNQTYTSIPNEGCYLNGQQIVRIHDREVELNNSLLGVLQERSLEEFTKIYKNVWNKNQGTRIYGCSASLFCRLATGELDASIIKESYIWEYASGLLIASESGCSTHVVNGNLFNDKKTDLILARDKGLLNNLIPLVNIQKEKLE